MLGYGKMLRSCIHKDAEQTNAVSTNSDKLTDSIS